MYIVRLIMILLVPAAWLLAFLLMPNQSDSWWVIGILLLLQLLVTIWELSLRRINKNFWHLCLLPVLFMLSVFMFSFFVVDRTIYYALTALASLGIYLLLKQYYYFFYFPYKYQPYSLESLAQYLTIFASFFFFCAAFASHILISIKLYYLLPVGVLLFSLFFEYFWMHKISFSKSWMFIVAICLVCFELFVAIAYLPVSYFVGATIITLFVHLALGLAKYFLQDSLSRGVIWRYVAIVSAALIAVLASARWN